MYNHNGVLIHKYDVCQINWSGEWMDYSTIKTPEDARNAVRLVNGEYFGGHPDRPFRIQRRDSTVYSRYSVGELDGTIHSIKAEDDETAIGRVVVMIQCGTLHDCDLRRNGEFLLRFRTEPRKIILES